MPRFEEVQVGSRRFKESSRSDGSGLLTRRSSGAGRVLAALGVVLSMLLGVLVTGPSPVSATGDSFSSVATVTGLASPVGVAVSPDGSRVYVANYYGGSVSVIDTSNNTVVATVTGLSYPYGVAVTPDGARVYVANNGSGSVSMISTGTNTVVGTVTVGSNHTSVAVSPDGYSVYVTNRGG